MKNKYIGLETIFTQKLLVNFTIVVKETESKTLNETRNS